jgi:hypothetical protein
VRVRCVSTIRKDYDVHIYLNDLLVLPPMFLLLVAAASAVARLETHVPTHSKQTVSPSSYCNVQCSSDIKASYCSLLLEQAQHPMRFQPLYCIICVIILP